MKYRQFIVTILLFISTIVFIVALASRKPPIVVKTNLENIPMQIGNYIAKNDTFSEAIYKELNADKHVYRHYKSPEGYDIDMYIGYYGTAKGGRTGHNPNACLPGSGWRVLKNKEIKINLNNSEKTENINYIIASKENIYNVMLHWYQSDRTKVINNGIEHNIQRFINRVFYGRNDGAFVRISTSTTKQYIKEKQLKLIEFAKKIITIMPKYWPVEKNL